MYSRYENLFSWRLLAGKKLKYLCARLFVSLSERCSEATVAFVLLLTNAKSVFGFNLGRRVQLQGGEQAGESGQIASIPDKLNQIFYIFVHV